MEVQLQELIEQIKKEGVEAASAESEAIIKNAKAEADKIIADAKVEADKIIADARLERERTVKTGEDALTQAGRNLLISLRESVSREIGVILSEAVSTAYSAEGLAGLIVKTVENWAAKPDAESLTVVLNNEELKTLEDGILAALKEKMIKGVTLKANSNFNGGFRISAKDGSAFYDYSAESVVEMLSSYLSPKVTELLKKAE